jgi:ferredoxin
MITVIHQRQKCIGCNYCVELAPEHWRMSLKDGKSVLICSIEKKGFWLAKLPESERVKNDKAAKACPVNIIQVR